MMILAALLGRLVLAVMFAVAGIAKLFDLRRTANAAKNFGVPGSLSLSFAAVLAMFEVAISIALLPTATARAGALFACALLWLFAGTIAVNLLRGRAPECHCFGQIHSASVSWVTVIRNLVLSGIAIVAWAGTPAGFSEMQWIAERSTTEVVVVLAIASLMGLAALEGFFFLRLMRAHGKLVLRVDSIEKAIADAGIHSVDSVNVGLAPATPIPSFTLREALSGREVNSEELASQETPVLMIFTSHECGACKSFLPEVAGWQKTYAGRVLIAVSSGTLEHAASEARQFGLENVFADDDLTAYKAFQVNATPSALLLSDGSVGSYVVAGREAISKLLNDILRQNISRIGEGMKVPPVELLSPEGTIARLPEILGEIESVLLFWNPECHFCQSMRHRIRSWELQSLSNSRRLIVITSGDAESAKTEGFLSPVFLDPKLELSTTLGANGTPMAVVIDSRGRVASPLATGAAAVMNLLEVGYEIAV